MKDIALAAAAAAWRQLASRPPVINAERLAEFVDLLGLRWDDGFAARIVAVSPAAELLAW